MFFARLFSQLPFWFFLRLSDILFVLLYHLVGYRKKVVLMNLRNSFPEKDEKEIGLIAKNFYRNLCDIFTETIKCLTISRGEIRRRIIIKNQQLPHDLIKKFGRVVVATSHGANWEFMITGLNTESYQVEGVYRPLTNQFADRFMYAVRSRFDGYPIPINNLTREAARRRNITQFMMMVADQSPGRAAKKYWTRFLNQETAFLKGTATFARMLKAPVLYAECVRLKRGYYQVTFEKLADPPASEADDDQIIQKYVERLEQQIRNHPSDWLWSHKRWKRKREDQEKI